MVIRDSHLNLLVLPYKKQTMVVLCAVREALAEVRPNTAPLGRSALGDARRDGVHPIPGKVRWGQGGGTLRSARFQAVCVAWSWFRQSSVISSRPAGSTTVGSVETTSTPKGHDANR